MGRSKYDLDSESLFFESCSRSWPAWRSAFEMQYWVRWTSHILSIVKKGFQNDTDLMAVMSNFENPYKTTSSLYIRFNTVSIWHADHWAPTSITWLFQSICGNNYKKHEQSLWSKWERQETGTNWWTSPFAKWFIWYKDSFKIIYIGYVT